MKISMVVSGDARGGARDRLGGRGTGFYFFLLDFYPYLTLGTEFEQKI